MIGALAATAVIAFLASLALNALAIRFARRFGFLDRPGAEAHKQQPRAVPYGGGGARAVAMAAALGIGQAPLAHVPATPPVLGRPFAAITLGALALFALGMIDDRRALGAGAKLAAQAVV